MFDKYLIVAGSAHDVVEDGAIVGFAFSVRFGYYRGLGISMVEPFDVVVDGEATDPATHRFTVSGRTFDYAGMATRPDVVWEMRDDAVITVLRPGGLGPGEHELELTEHLRVSYLPFVAAHHDRKTIRIPAA